jgi:hypothetical protein
VPKSIQSTSPRGLPYASENWSPVDMCRACRSVIAPRGSPAVAHSGTRSGSSSAIRPSRTSTPTSALTTLLVIDHPGSGESTP